MGISGSFPSVRAVILAACSNIINVFSSRKVRLSLVTLPLTMLAFALVTVVSVSAADFTLNSSGDSHIYWMFENSTWASRDGWLVSGGTSLHKGSDYYADDWYKATDAETCGKNIKAPISGTIIFSGQAQNAGGGRSSYGNSVIIQSNINNNFAWRGAHMQSGSLTKSAGQSVNAGDIIGKVGGTGATDTSWACHLHSALYKSIYESSSQGGTGFSRLQTWGTTIDEITSSTPNKFATPFYNDATGTTPPPPTTDCDDVTYNGIALYAGDNCAGNSEHKEFSSPTGSFIDLPGQGWNDKANSVYVKSGWSVKVFEHTSTQDGGGRNKCLNHSYWDLDLDQWDQGGTIGAGISSIILYSNSTTCTGAVQPPSAPTLQSPASGSTFSDSQSITLQWSATGNDYYGEILGGPNGTLYFDWQTGTTKNIGTQWPGTYQWHVKARNSGGTSGWSGTWTFTVQASDDAYEQNDTLATAWYPGSNWEQRWLSSFSGYGKQSDDDWYKIDVSDNERRLNIDLRFTDSQGDIDLGLYNSVGTLLDSSAGTADNEYIDYTVSSGGTYYIKVYYDNAGNTYDLWWDDIALPVPPSAPALISPASGTSFTSTQQITLQWSATGNDYYGEILGGPNGTIYFDWQTGTSKNIGTQWPGTYQWHIKARNAVGQSGWSASWTFTVQAADDSYEQNDTLATAWYPGSNWEQRWLSSFSGYGKQSDDDWYKIDVSDSEKRLNIDLRFTHSQGDIDLALFNSSEVQLAVSNGSADNEYIDYTVAAGGTYYLVVYYGNAGNTYDLWWDDIGLPVPAAPTLVSPVNGSAFSSGTSMNLDWNASSGATDYYAHLTGPGVDRNSGWTTNTNWVAGVLAAGTYQWNVKARNANGESAVSATWSFTINQVVDCNSFSYNGIILFADPTCRGTEVRFPAATQITNLSGYSFDNLSSSIYVGSGWSVRVYEQANGAGLTRCITGSMWNLGVDTYDGSSTYINNTVSSVQVFNNTSCAVPLVNNAQFISQSVPTAMVVGQTYTVSVTMKNTGNKPWTQVGNYKLGSQNPSDSSTWGMHRVFLNTGEVVNPGAQKVFTFNVTAPTTPGTYNFQWRMLQEYVEWFGGTSTNVAVIVSDGSLPVNSTWYQESDSKMYYTSGWTLRTNVSASGGKYMQTSTQGAYVEFKTMGNAFTLKRIMSSARGTMNVCIDGVCQTINNYSATTKFQQQLVFKNLAGNAPHTIRVVNNQAKPMDLDAVLVWSYVMYPLTPSTTWYQENNANFVYIRVADWVTKSSTSASGGKYIQSSVQGAYVDFKVQSNAFTLKRKMSPSSGTMNVCIDGVCQTIDNYSATTKWQQQLVFKNLTGTLPHTIRITNNQAKVIDIDSILSWSFVMNPLVPSLTWYQENNVNLLYTRTADWTSVSSTSASSGKYIQTNVQSAYVELKVQNSSSFIIMRKMDSSRGTINVCIDGVCQSVSNYSPTVKWKQQQTFYLSGTGVHTIRIVNNEYKVMDIDAIKVL